MENMTSTGTSKYAAVRGIARSRRSATRDPARAAPSAARPAV
jgi:hypothetical protein